MYGCANNKFSDMHEESAIDNSYHLEKLNLKMSLFKVAYAMKSAKTPQICHFIYF